MGQFLWDSTQFGEYIMIKTCMYNLSKVLKLIEKFSKYIFMAAYIIMYQKFSSLDVDEKFKVPVFSIHLKYSR